MLSEKVLVVLELNDRGFLFAHDVVAHDNGETTVQLVECFLRNLFAFRFFRKREASPNRHVPAMQTIFAEFRTGIVLQLCRLSCSFFTFFFASMPKGAMSRANNIEKMILLFII